MPTISATLISYFHTCHRKLWLHHHGIRMEHTSDTVYEGKLIGDSTYEERANKNKQIELDGVKIDFYDPKTKTVHETKKSDKMEHAHIAQVKYYLYILRRNGIEGAQGLIEYPKLRERTWVSFEPETDGPEIERWLADIDRILKEEQCPSLLNKPVCRNCSYFDYCYAGEV